MRGCTALLDAIGRTISKIKNALEHTAEEERPEHVLFVITTDGLENASRNYHADSRGTQLNYEVISDAVSCLRTTHKLSEDWKARIDEDFKKRGSRKRA